MMTPPKPAPSDIVAALSQAERVLLAGHVFPDADALGSQLALGGHAELLVVHVRDPWAVAVIFMTFNRLRGLVHVSWSVLRKL